MSRPAATQQQAARPALELIEEAVMLLRRSPLSTLILYFTGAVPFWLGLLYFLADMSRSAYAADQLAGRSLVMAGLFLWMKCWHAIFAERLHFRLLGEASEPWTARRAAGLIATQAALQGWSIPARIAAGTALIPTVWVSAFYQNITVFGAAKPGPESLSARAWRQARLWPGQAHAMMICLSVFALLVFANVLTIMIVSPGLVKMLLGIETEASRDTSALLNTTFFIAAYGLASLCFDPVWKAAFVLRCFHGEALRTGADLKLRLRSVRQGRLMPATLALGALLLLGGMSFPVTAAPPETPTETVDSARLNRSIDDVLERREYAWRAPRDAHKEDQKGMLDSGFERMLKLMQKVQNGIGSVLRWIFDKIFKGWMGHGRPGDGSGSIPPVRQILYFLLAIGGILFAWLLWRQHGKRRPKTAVVTAMAAMPDLEAPDVAVNDLAEDGWLRFARELIERGEYRLALRAIYLAGLAHLGERQLLTITRYKSNREYDLELRRRARARAELIAAFEENLRVFEGVWYGVHEVTQATFDRFHGNLERIRSC